MTTMADMKLPMVGVALTANGSSFEQLCMTMRRINKATGGLRRRGMTKIRVGFIARLHEPEEKRLATWFANMMFCVVGDERWGVMDVSVMASHLPKLVDEFFKTCRLDTEDDGLRQARMALLRYIHRTVSMRFADLSKIRTA